MGKASLGVLLGQAQGWGSKYLNEVGKSRVAPSCSIMEPMVFCTSVVSGTFSCSTTLTPGIFLISAAAWACAWL